MTSFFPFLFHCWINICIFLRGSENEKREHSDDDALFASWFGIVDPYYYCQKLYHFSNTRKSHSPRSAHIEGGMKKNHENRNGIFTFCWIKVCCLVIGGSEGGDRVSEEWQMCRCLLRSVRRPPRRTWEDWRNLNTIIVAEEYSCWVHYQIKLLMATCRPHKSESVHQTREERNDLRLSLYRICF